MRSKFAAPGPTSALLMPPTCDKAFPARVRPRSFIRATVTRRPESPSDAPAESAAEPHMRRAWQPPRTAEIYLNRIRLLAAAAAAAAACQAWSSTNERNVGCDRPTRCGRNRSSDRESHRSAAPQAHE
uniref:Uncharacterized protein n=1 Tax=Plectus sambesii TaxID=2011161 RepID=A0A914XQA5_9BILA